MFKKTKQMYALKGGYERWAGIRGVMMRVATGIVLFAALPGAQAQDDEFDVASYAIDELLVVECKLPGRIRKIGRYATTIGPGKTVRSTALDCGIRGGRYDIYDPANYETARLIWEGKAEGGDRTAQNYLGEMYERGLGTDVDYTIAAKWYRLAAEQDYAAAQVNLGNLYERGLGVPTDEQKAVEWFRKASGQTNVVLAPELVLDTESTTGLAPRIHLIDPLLARTRGVSVVPVNENAERRQIIGRVETPAGLLSLTINDSETDVGDNGIFRSVIDVRPSGTPVSIVALDVDGRRAERQLTITPEAVKQDPVIDADFGNYHALVIGNDKYSSLPALKTARSDARAVAEILEQSYGFEVTLLEDADRIETMDALNAYNKRLTSDDNFLIYYAGHGNLDTVNNRGHWLPVDSEPDSNTNWIPEVVITDMLRIMTAKHVMVVADSCYSGSLTRSAQTTLRPGRTDDEREVYYRSVLKSRSRTALTSGGLAPVLDDGADGHSVFAGAFIEVLQSNRDILEGQRLFLQLVARVTAAANRSEFDQVPQYAPIKFSGHESGDFLLVPGSARIAKGPEDGVTPVADLAVNY
ncbi:MAG: caspase family protein [Gammaproteobacteria bacterium]|nr:caspase family protein [Gammaproteobacteria bacterium]